MSADEPTGNLDTKTGNDVIEVLRDGIKKYGQTLILITHNSEIAKIADRVICLKNRIHQTDGCIKRENTDRAKSGGNIFIGSSNLFLENTI